MHLTSTGCETGLLSYYQFNETPGSTLLTDRANNNDGTLTNMNVVAAWNNSVVNVGLDTAQTSNSQTISSVPVGASTQNFASANLSIEFTAHSTNEDFTVTYQAFAPNSTAGASGANIIQNPMWTINKSTATSTQTMNLGFNLGAGSISATRACEFRLYHRPMYSGGTWSLLATKASAVNANTVRFDNINVTGQFMVVEDPAAASTVSDVRGNMYSFDGVNDFISVPHDPVFNMPGSSDFSFEAWVYPTANLSETILSKGHGGGGSNPDVYIFQISNRRIALELSDGSAHQWRVSNTQMTLNEWHHVAAVYNSISNTVTFYLDGVEDGVLAYSITPSSHGDNQPLFIAKQGWGCCGGSGGNFFDGKMDEVRIWNTTRTQAEIRENRHLRLEGCENGLIAYYQFDNDLTPGTVAGVIDALGNHNATTQNMAVSNLLASEVPIAAGLVDRLNVTGTGVVNFPNTGLSIDFSTSPNGEVVVSRLTTERPYNWGTIGQDVDDEYFVVNNYGANVNPNVSSMTLNNIETIDPVDAASPNLFRLYQRPSNDYLPWPAAIATASSATPSPAASLTFTGTPLLTGFSQFVVATDIANPSDLPVEWLNFSANRLHPTQVALNWSTATELNNKGFWIERMLGNETDFSPIGFVEGVGESTQIQQYEFLDEQASAALSYYRLKQEDFDGTSSYSEVRAVSGTSESQTISVFPNPAKSAIFIQFGDQTVTKKAHIQLCDVLGHQLYAQHTVLEGTETLTLPRSSRWSSGMYILTIQIDDAVVFRQKLILE